MSIDSRLLFSIANGAYLNGDAIARARQMAKLKASGLVPAVPDLELALPTRLWPGMFIEMKRQDGRATPEQIDMLSLLRGRGYNCILALGADEAIRAIKGYVAGR